MPPARRDPASVLAQVTLCSSQACPGCGGLQGSGLRGVSLEASRGLDSCGRAPEGQGLARQPAVLRWSHGPSALPGPAPAPGPQTCPDLSACLVCGLGAWQWPQVGLGHRTLDIEEMLPTSQCPTGSGDSTLPAPGAQAGHYRPQLHLERGHSPVLGRPFLKLPAGCLQHSLTPDHPPVGSCPQGTWLACWVCFIWAQPPPSVPQAGRSAS